MRNLAGVSAVKCFPSWAEACFFKNGRRIAPKGWKMRATEIKDCFQRGEEEMKEMVITDGRRTAIGSNLRLLGAQRW